jgi:hypothetical protein
MTQAFINKHFKGCNARWFAPERIRELAPSERGERGAATFVSLEGLGKIPFSNIRRPKPLMDVGTTPGDQVGQRCSFCSHRSRHRTDTPCILCKFMLNAIRHAGIRANKPYPAAQPTTYIFLRCQAAQDSEDGSKNGGSRKARRPLEQEPAMAARIMIEDCLALLLDVQDVDRLFAASPSALLRLADMPHGARECCHSPMRYLHGHHPQAFQP